MRLVSDSAVLGGSLSGHTARASEFLLLPTQAYERGRLLPQSESQGKTRW